MYDQLRLQVLQEAGRHRVLYLFILVSMLYYFCVKASLHTSDVAFYVQCMLYKTTEYDFRGALACTKVCLWLKAGL